MLIKCPECGLQISDKAAFCPHCGYVITERKLYPPKRNPNKRRRLPNGFGQISEIKGANLRKRFRVLVPVGKTKEGRYISKPLKPHAYFETYNDAYEALLEYNRSPYDLGSADMTVAELYEKWFTKYKEGLKSSTSIRTITAPWKYCSSIYDFPVKSLRAGHIKDLIDNATITENEKTKKASAGTKARIKSIFNLMLDYALEFDLVDKNYARTFSISDDVINEQADAKKQHIVFTDSELQILWNNISMDYVDILLYQCYSGWRPQELCLLKIENVDMDKMEIIGGMKTDAGTNRTVPIHPRVKDIIAKRYTEAKSLGSEYLFNCTDGKTHKANSKLTYDKYNYRLAKIISDLNLNTIHRPHDGRKTFISLCKNSGVDEYALKYMVGHTITDITESVYTERNGKWLHEEIAKIN